MGMLNEVRAKDKGSPGDGGMVIHPYIPNKRYNYRSVFLCRGALQPRSGQARQISCNGARSARHVRGPLAAGF